MTQMFLDTGYKSTKLNTSITIKNPNITSYSSMFSGIATKEGSQITVNYTSKTSSLVDKMIATKTEGANVVKGDLVEIITDDIDVGDEIAIGSEHFNVISQTEDTVAMLAKYSLGEDYKQSESGKGMGFSSSRGWEYTPGPKEIDIQQYDGPVKRYLNAYVDYLKTLLKNDAIAGDLISLKELENLGCEISSDYSSNLENVKCDNSSYKSWLINGITWTRSASSSNDKSVWLMYNNGVLMATTFTSAYPFRPVITISKETLRNLDKI
jgi:hypothetical protein